MKEKLVFSNPPLQFALIEVKFEDIKNIENKEAEVQELFRDFFITANPGVSKTVNYDAGTGETTTDIKKITNYLSRDKKSSITVSRNTFMYCTTTYADSGSFFDEFYRRLDQFVALFNHIDINRIGVRYGDMIELKGPSELGTLVVDDLNCPTAISGVDSIESIYQKNESLLKTPEGIMLFRSLIAITKYSVFPDANLPINLKEYDSGLKLMLDTDHFDEFQEPISYDEEFLKEKIKNMHKFSSNVFFNLFTDEAKQRWK